MALGKEFDGGATEVLMSLILTSVKEHLHELSHLAGSGEEAGVAADTTHGIGVGVVDGATDKASEGVLLGRGNGK